MFFPKNELGKTKNMRKTKKKTTDESSIKAALTEIGGEKAYDLYKVLKGKENVDEFLIANKLQISINQLRNLIYKFEQHNLITSTRKKDRKKGWYIYFFTQNEKQIEELVAKLRNEKIKDLQRQLDKEAAHEFYRCPNKCMRLTTENAMENSFMCLECGNLLELESQEKNLTRIKKAIKELETKKES
jgi:transcription initiation factor TFIIE subunit alpha